MFRIGPMELVIIFLIVLVLFGAKRLPEIGQGLGKGIINFKRAMKEPESLGDSSEDETVEKK